MNISKITNIVKDQQYYRFTLDDYAAPAFVSADKDYFGTLSDIENFIGALKDDNHSQIYKQLSSALETYKNGEHNAAHTVAYNEVPFLVPVNLLEAVSYTMPTAEWEHLNVWKCPYKMRFQLAEIQQFWFESDDKYIRAMKAKITDLKCEEYNDSWIDIKTPWGFPHIIEKEAACTYNRLAITDKRFDSKTEAEIDYEHFLSAPDTDFTEFCNDIFGDG